MCVRAGRRIKPTFSRFIDSMARSMPLTTPTIPLVTFGGGGGEEKEEKE